MPERELVNILPNISELKRSVVDSLQCIANDKDRANACYHILKMRAVNIRDIDEEFHYFFISRNGPMERFLKVVDFLSPSPDRDKLLLSTIDLLMEYTAASSHEIEGFARLECLLMQLQSERWKEQILSRMIEVRIKNSWNAPTRKKEYFQHLDSLIHEMKKNHVGLQIKSLHCRSQAKFARILVESDHAMCGMELAYCIELKFYRFLALLDMSRAYLSKTRDTENSNTEFVISLLKGAEQLIPEISDEYGVQGDYLECLRLIAELYEELGLYDKMMTAIDRIPFQAGKIRTLTWLTEKIANKREFSEIRRIIIRYYAFAQSMNLVEKAKWMHVVTKLIKRYGNTMNAEHMVAIFQKEVLCERDKLRQMKALLELGCCYQHLNEKSQALHVFQSVEREAKMLPDTDLALYYRAETLATMSRHGLRSHVTKTLEATDDPELLALTYAKISRVLDGYYLETAGRTNMKILKCNGMMIKRIVMAVPLLKNPFDRAVAYCHLIETHTLYEAQVQRYLNSQAHGD